MGGAHSIQILTNSCLLMIPLLIGQTSLIRTDRTTIIDCLANLLGTAGTLHKEKHGGTTQALHCLTVKCRPIIYETVVFVNRRILELTPTLTFRNLFVYYYAKKEVSFKWSVFR